MKPVESLLTPPERRTRARLTACLCHGVLRDLCVTDGAAVAGMFSLFSRVRTYRLSQECVRIVSKQFLGLLSNLFI